MNNDRKKQAVHKALREFSKVFTEGSINRSEVKAFLLKWGITIEDIIGEKS